MYFISVVSIALVLRIVIAVGIAAPVDELGNTRQRHKHHNKDRTSAKVLCFEEQKLHCNDHTDQDRPPQETF